MTIEVGQRVEDPQPSPRPPTSRRPPFEWRAEVAFLALSVLAGLACLSTVLFHAGWPTSQVSGFWGNGLAIPMIETQAYAAHIRHFDLLPVWQSSDAYGMGSPVFVYYGKLYYYVSAVIYLLIAGHIKVASVLAVLAFMLVGTYGMRAALSLITRNRAFVWAGSLALIFTNYAVTEWLVRGDFAEFSAMMLVPWVLWWALRLVKDRAFSLWGAPLLLLVILAHAVVAELCVVVVVVAAGVMVTRATRTEIAGAARRAALSALALAVVLLPLGVVALRFSSHFDPVTKFSLGSDNFTSLSVYLFGGAKRVFQGYVSANRQVDPAIWLSIVAGSLVALASVLVRRRTPRRSPRAAVAAFLLGSLAVFVALQLPVTGVLYRHIVPLRDIQFPWRMLTFITPMGILVVALLADAAWRRGRDAATRSQALRVGLTMAPFVWLLAVVVPSPAFAVQHWGPLPQSQFVPARELVAPRVARYGEIQLMVGTHGEFLPQLGHQSALETLALYRRMWSTGRQAQVLSGGPCTVREPRNTPFEAQTFVLHVSCDEPARLALPLTDNGYTRLFARTDGALRPLALRHVAGDPRVVIDVPAAGAETVEVHLPTMWSVLF